MDEEDYEENPSPNDPERLSPANASSSIMEDNDIETVANTSVPQDTPTTYTFPVSDFESNIVTKLPEWHSLSHRLFGDMEDDEVTLTEMSELDDDQLGDQEFFLQENIGNLLDPEAAIPEIEPEGRHIDQPDSLREEWPDDSLEQPEGNFNLNPLIFAMENDILAEPANVAFDFSCDSDDGDSGKGTGSIASSSSSRSSLHDDVPMRKFETLYPHTESRDFAHVDSDFLAALNDATLLPEEEFPGLAQPFDIPIHNVESHDVPAMIPRTQEVSRASSVSTWRRDRNNLFREASLRMDPRSSQAAIHSYKKKLESKKADLYYLVESVLDKYKQMNASGKAYSPEVLSALHMVFEKDMIRILFKIEKWERLTLTMDNEQDTHQPIGSSRNDPGGEVLESIDSMVQRYEEIQASGSPYLPEVLSALRMVFDEDMNRIRFYLSKFKESPPWATLWENSQDPDQPGPSNRP